MKSRRYNLIIGVFVMFISNIIYFFWMPYPKGFLKTVGSTTFVFDVLTNLLFFSLYSVMLIVAINAITNTGCKLRTKKVAAILGICIAVQLGCDITKYITGYLMRQFALISDDFFTVVSVLVLSLVVMKLLGAKVSYKKLYAIFAPIMILILIVYTVLDVRYIHSMSNVAEKYFGTPSNILSALSLSDSSSVAATILKNMEPHLQRKRLRNRRHSTCYCMYWGTKRRTETMSKWCFNYETGDYEDIDRDGYSYTSGGYTFNWDDSEYRREEEEEERRQREEEEEERRQREEEEDRCREDDEW